MSLEISSGPLFVRIGGRYVQTEHTVEEFDHLRADLQRLQSSPAPVVGGVPELTDGEVRDAWYAVEQDPEQVGDAYQDGVRYGYALAASRLSSIKPGEEVVNSEEYAALRDFAERIVPIRDNLSGISWVGNLKDVFAAYDNWYAIRIAQGTPTEKVGNV